MYWNTIHFVATLTDFFPHVEALRGSEFTSFERTLVMSRKSWKWGIHQQPPFSETLGISQREEKMGTKCGRTQGFDFYQQEVHRRTNVRCSSTTFRRLVLPAAPSLPRRTVNHWRESNYRLEQASICLVTFRTEYRCQY
jgi:hypothetical protein